MWCLTKYREFKYCRYYKYKNGEVYYESAVFLIECNILFEVK